MNRKLHITFGRDDRFDQTRLVELGLRLYETLDTPRSLMCSILMRHGMWVELQSLKIDPRHYLDATSVVDKFRRDYQATDFLRKTPLVGKSQKARTEAAEQTFRECELQCRETNDFLRFLQSSGECDTRIRRSLRVILSKAEKTIKRILGPVPDDLALRFSSGTCFDLKGSTYSTVADKVWVTPHVTRSCEDVFSHLYTRTAWYKERSRVGLPFLAYCEGNRFSTVPKDGTKDRGICIEPLANLSVQLGIGGYMKGRLASVGLFTGSVSSRFQPWHGGRRFNSSHDGQDIHRHMARMGSKLDSYATIDLSNASDTVAYELVRWLLPPDWFALLDSARSPNTYFKGKWVKLEKFSSMGNGFTFELETLIFAALAAAVTGLRVGADILCYGDDIIVPKDVSEDVIATLSSVGFTPNPRKCFSSGPFRESCGGDYFLGEDVRPVQVTGKLDEPLEVMALHNHLRQKVRNSFRCCSYLRRCLPVALRVSGPERVGNAVLHGWPYKARPGDTLTFGSSGPKKPGSADQTFVRVVTPVHERVPLDRWGEELTLLLALLGASGDGVSPRDSVAGYRYVWLSVS